MYSGLGTYEGGGLFLSDASYKLHAIWAGRTRKKASSLVRDDNSGPEIDGTGDLPVYFARLKRDGWQRLTGQEKVFDKLLPCGWILRKHLRGKYTAKSERGRGLSWDEHELINTQSGASIDGNNWEWADWDRNSIVWATKGCLYRASIKSNLEIGSPAMLHDFTPYTFEEREAPH
ncbi:MAG: hypothetical protein HOP09_11415 [Hyphomicrobium sp.]|nr:hypothetical protein [Hyphomicrobium sp.]